MDRKAIAGLLAGCEPDQMLKFRDEGDLVVVITAEGKKYKYTNEQLEAAEPKPPEKNIQGQATPKAKAAAKAPAKRRARARKPVTKS